MPTLSAAQLAKWRSHPQKSRGFLYVHRPTEVCRRRVNQAVAGLVTSLIYDNAAGADTGSVADIQDGYTLEVYDDDDTTFKGYTRIRSASGTESAGLFFVTPTGAGDIEFANNDLLVVLAERKPWAKIPYITPTGTMYKDYNTAYTDQTDDFPPIANAGSAKAGFVDLVTGVATFDFDGSGIAMADGASISSYAWAFDDGTPATAATADVTGVTFPPGFRWASLTVTDSNSKTHTAYVPVVAVDTWNFTPLRARISRRGYNASIGWEASFELYDADLSDIPEHALCIFWTEEWFGLETGAIDGNNVKFVGWITSEELTMEPLWSDTLVNAQGPLAVLQQRPAFPQTVRRDATPADWTQVKGLDHWKNFVYLLMFHSNLLELCDIERPTFYNSYPVTRLDADAGTLYDQLKFQADVVCAQLTADARGALYLRRVPHLMQGSERLLYAVPTIAMTEADLRADPGPHWERPHWDTLGWLRGAAIEASATLVTPLLTIAPGPTPGQGPQIESIDRMLMGSQTELNERIGHLYAYRQSRRDGARVMRHGEVILAHSGGVVDPAWQEVITLTLDDGLNRRGFTFNAARMVPVGIEITDDHEVHDSLERLELEQETRGAAATMEAVPTETANDGEYGSYEPPVIIEPEPDTATLELSATDVYAADETTIRHTSNFTATTPDWDVKFTSTDIGASWVIRAFELDKFAPKTKAYVVVTDLSNTRVYRTTNLTASPPTWSQILSATWGYRCDRALLFGTHEADGTWFLMIEHNDNNLWIEKTVDAFATPVEIAYTGLSGRYRCMNLEVSGHNGGTGNGVVLHTYHTGTDAIVKKSTNYGTSYAATCTPANSYYPPHGVIMPWLGNESQLKWFVAGGSSSLVDAYVNKTTDGGASFTDVTPTYGGTPYGGGVRNNYVVRFMHYFRYTDGTSRFVGAFAPSQDKTGGDQRFFVSDDDGANWTSNAVTGNPMVHGIGGWPYSKTTFILNCSNALLLTTDAGATFADKAWAGYSNGIWCVPVWIA